MVASKSNEGLDAAGYLLLAEGHLRKAEEILAREDKEHLVSWPGSTVSFAPSAESGRMQWAARLVAGARMSTKQAHELLKQEKELQ